MGNRKEISIIIQVSSSQSLDRLLGNLSVQTLPVAAFEVFLVGESAQVEGGMTYFAFPAFDLHKICVDSGADCYEALNRAVEQAVSSCLLFLDSNLDVAPGLLQAHLEAHYLQAMPCMVQGGLRFHSSCGDSPLNRALEDGGFVHTKGFVPDGLGPPTWFLCSNASVSRGALMLVGGFSSGYQRSLYRGFDLSLRLEEHKRMRVFHSVGAAGVRLKRWTVAHWLDACRTDGADATHFWRRNEKGLDISSFMTEKGLAPKRLLRERRRHRRQHQDPAKIVNHLCAAVGEDSTECDSEWVAFGDGQSFLLPKDNQAFIPAALNYLTQITRYGGVLDALLAMAGDQKEVAQD